MAIFFSQLPGRHERHYRRRLDNPLFPGDPAKLDEELLLEMQRLDHEELLAFLTELRQAVQRAVDLKPNEGSEVILGLKEQLDRLYEVSAGLADDQAANQGALAQLIEVIMRNVERSAAGDAQALDELAQERVARAAQFELLAWPLVADLLHPHSTIGAGELASSLLSESEESLAAGLQLFDLEQLSQLFADAQQSLQACVESPPDAVARLGQIGARLAQLRQQATLN